MKERITKSSFVVAVSLFLLAACQTSGRQQTADASEMMGQPGTAEQLAAFLYGKPIQDVDCADHWVEFSADGTAVGALRGKTFDMACTLEGAAGATSSGRRAPIPIA
ncbi:MAG: hypothetical protein ACTS3R_08445 [Inquilinaceae bacterium]